MNSSRLSDLTSDPTIILIPGLDGTALLFYRQIPLLANYFNVAAFPLPDDRNANMDSLVEGLRQMILEIAPGGAVLIGESFGGALAMSAALAHPELVSGLILVNTFPWLDNRIQLHAGRWLLKAVPWAAMPHIRRGTESRIHSPHTTSEDLAEFHDRMRHIGADGYRQRLKILRRYDIRDRLSDITAPSLILAGDADQLLPSVRWAEYMHKWVPHSSYQILEGYGHVCLITHDLDLTDYVVPWWDDSKRDLPSNP
jgi:pimeloyl-ACP methyl ester carboxylesterase